MSVLDTFLPGIYETTLSINHSEHSQILHLLIFEGVVNNELRTIVLRIWSLFKWPLPTGNQLTVSQCYTGHGEIHKTEVECSDDQYID